MKPTNFTLVAGVGAGNSMNIRIVKATESDLPEILKLAEQANMHYVPSDEMPALTIENYFIARDGDKLVGFSGYKMTSSDSAKSELMVVDNYYRGRGIGYKLQRARMKEMLVKGARRLITNSDLPATIGWYKRKFGYQEIGRLKKIHEFGDPEIHEWTTLEVDLLEWDARDFSSEEDAAREVPQTLPGRAQRPPSTTS